MNISNINITNNTNMNTKQTNINRLEPATVDALKKLPREEVEKEMTFVGFVVFDCPLKPDSAGKTNKHMDELTNINK